MKVCDICIGLFETPFHLGDNILVFVQPFGLSADFAAHNNVTGSLASGSDNRCFINGHADVRYVSLYRAINRVTTTSSIYVDGSTFEQCSHSMDLALVRMDVHALQILLNVVSPALYAFKSHCRVQLFQLLS